MAVFKRVDYQQVYSFEASQTVADGGAAVVFKVGDLIARNPSTNDISRISTMAAAKQSKDDGMELYILSQSDAITYKTGTEYKKYDLDRTIEVSSNSAKPSIVAGYRVDNLDNIEL